MKAKPTVMPEEKEREHSCPPSLATEDVGSLPSSWRVAPMGDFLTEAQYGMSVKGGTEGRCAILRMTNQVNGRISPTKLQYAEITDRELANFCVQRGDILFNRTNSIELVGRTSIFEIPGVFVFASYLIRLRTLPDKLDPSFLNLYLNADATQRRLKGIATRGVSQSNISATRLKTFTVPVPPLPEQQKIAAVLGVVQRAMEQQERLLALTAELQKTLLHQLFTQGLRHEPQKETDIGPVPEGWEVAPLGDYLTEAQYGLSAKGGESGRCALLRMTNQQHGRITGTKLQFVELPEREFQKFRVERNDLLFNRTNSLELVGRTALFDLEGDFVFASYLIRLRADPERLRPHFLNHYFNSEDTQKRLKGIATRAVSQSNISATRLRGFAVPVPPVEDQDEIIATLDAVDAKIQSHRRKHAALTTLFRTLLHQLMTAQIRVAGLALEEILEQAVRETKSA